MNIRRKLVLALGAGPLIAPFASFAQQAAKVYRIGFLGSGSASIYAGRIAALRTRLREFGYAEDKNIIIVLRYADGKYEGLPGLAAEIIALNPDVILAAATPAILAAQRATKTIPIVMSPVTDPVGSGFVANLAQPGGNITGVSIMSVDITAKSLELLHSVVPKAGRIAVLMSNNPSHPAQFKEVQKAAKVLALTVVSFNVTDPSQFESTASFVSKSKCEALLVLNDPMLISLRQQIAEFAAKARLPAIYQTDLHVEAGGL